MNTFFKLFPLFVFLCVSVKADEALLQEAKGLFTEANEATEQSTELYQKAALRYERLANQAPNGEVYYNLANSYYRAGDLGRAILNYRRAQQYNPSDEQLRQNLALARQKRVDTIEPSADRSVLRTLFLYNWAFESRYNFFLFSVLLFWVCAVVYLYVRRPPIKLVMGLSGALALILLASLLTESWTLQRSLAGVIILPEVTARQGDSTSYQASFETPLHAGTEFVLLEKRLHWLHVTLADKRQCWLPAKAVEMVK